MKILYILHQFFPHYHTGTERLTLDIAKQIQRMGNYVSVLTYEPSPPPIENSSKIIYKVEQEEKDFKKIDDYILKKEYQFESIPVVALKHDKFQYGFKIFEDKLEKYLFEIIKGFDVIHFTHPMRFSSALKICKKLKIPTVLTLTDNWLLSPRGLLTAENQLCDGPQEGRECMRVCNYDDKVLSRYSEAKFFFDSIDRVFSGTNFVRQTFWENGWQRNIELNTFSIDYSHVSAELPNSKQIVFAFIGSLIWHKGMHVLIEAFRKVENENIKLKIYGRAEGTDGYVKHLMNRREGLETIHVPKTDKRIEFCGTFEYKDLSHIMKEISVIVIPSVYKEIFPLVMQMALAYKKPVIATDIGGMPEVIHDGVNGHLFPVNDEDELAKIIQMLADNPKRIEDLRQNIKSPRRIEEECLVYENAYRELLKK